MSPLSDTESSRHRFHPKMILKRSTCVLYKRHNIHDIKWSEDEMKIDEFY